MSNEFVTRNGFVSLDNSRITGSLNVSAGITGSLFGTASFAVSASSVTSASFASTASLALSVTGGFSKSFAIVNNSNIQATDIGIFPVWRCNVACTASLVIGYNDSGSSVVVNAAKNGADLLASNLTISTTNTWASSSTLQNQNFNVGDILAFRFVSFAGSPKEVTIQTNFIY